MQHLTRVALLCLAVALSLAGVSLAGDAPGRPLDGESVRVLSVIDGDTIRVERADGDVERVRYIGIDTPEIAHEPGESDEPWGSEATDANASLVEDAIVLLERDVSDTDPYDRLLRYVWVETTGGPRMVNGELVSLGLADVQAYEPDTRHHAWFLTLQEEARQAGRGMYAVRSEAEEEGSLFERILEFFFGP